MCMMKSVLSSLPVTEGDDFQILEYLPVNGKSYQCPLLVPALDAGSTRIDVQHIQCLIKLHLQDMRMTSNEKLGRIGIERAPDGSIVVPRVTADVFNQHIHILALETVQFPVHQSEVTPVAVAADSPERPEGSQFLGHLHTPDVSGVPDLVAGLEVVQVFVIPIAMGVADNANLLHVTVGNAVQ